jgi:hypothetical protein
MELALRTQPAVDQLALWYMVSGRAITRTDLISVLMIDVGIFTQCLQYPKMNRRNYREIIVAYRNLFSSCKTVRAHLHILYSLVEKIFVVESEKHVPDMSRLMGLSYGDHFVLLNNFFFDGIANAGNKLLVFRGKTHFPARCWLISQNGGQEYDIVNSNWTLPLHPIRQAVVDLFLRLQRNRSLFEFLKFGFFSSRRNRSNTLTIFNMVTETPGIRELVVQDRNVFDAFFHHLEYSYGVVDLTPQITGVPEDQAFTYLTGLTGLHIGVTPRQIDEVNEMFARKGTPVGLTFMPVE